MESYYRILRRRSFAAFLMMQRIGTRLGSARVTAIYPSDTDTWTGETDSGVAEPGRFRDHSDHGGWKGDSSGPPVCILTPWREACGQWLEEHVGGMWVGGSLCVGWADLGDLLCGLDMAGFVEKADYSLSYFLDPRPAPSA